LKALNVNNRARTFALCCIVDENPRFYVEFVLWVICVRRYLPDNFLPRMYVVGDVPHDLIDWARENGVQSTQIERMVEGSPHSNKIAPFFDDHSTDFTIVCDTDLFFVVDPSGLLNSDRFRAAPNNACNPPPRIFQSILAASGLDRPYRPGVALFKGSEGLRETHVNNISAGIVVAPSTRAAELAARWRRWATWLVENRVLLENWAVHVDQVAFALSMEELQEDVEFLPPQMNTILQLLDEVSTCFALHLTTGHIPDFPQMFNADRTMVTEGLEDSVKAGLDRLNSAILEAVEVINVLPSTRGHLDKFLNPAWRR
jgi:hypothetical protein